MCSLKKAENTNFLAKKGGSYFLFFQILSSNRDIHLSVVAFTDSVCGHVVALWLNGLVEGAWIFCGEQKQSVSSSSPLARCNERLACPFLPGLAFSSKSAAESLQHALQTWRWFPGSPRTSLHTHLGSWHSFSANRPGQTLTGLSFATQRGEIFTDRSTAAAHFWSSSTVQPKSASTPISGLIKWTMQLSFQLSNLFFSTAAGTPPQPWQVAYTTDWKTQSSRHRTNSMTLRSNLFWHRKLKSKNLIISTLQVILWKKSKLPTNTVLKTLD